MSADVEFHRLINRRERTPQVHAGKSANVFVPQIRPLVDTAHYKDFIYLLTYLLTTL